MGARGDAACSCWCRSSRSSRSPHCSYCGSGPAILRASPRPFSAAPPPGPVRPPPPLAARPAPRTDLPPLPGLERDGKAVPGLDSAEFQGRDTVLSVWASWCVPCREEAALLMTVAADPRVRVVGMNYKDQPDNARRFLGRYGNPFAANGTDGNGRAAIE